MSNPNEEPRWDKNSRENQAHAAAWIEERESGDWSDARQGELDAWIAEFLPIWSRFSGPRRSGNTPTACGRSAILDP